MIDHDQPANDKQAYIFIAVAGVAIYFLSAEMPRFADDYCHVIAPFRFGDLPALLLSDYHGWTGRLPAVAVTYLVFSTDHGLLWFHLANGAAVSLVLVVVWRQLSHLHHIQRMAVLFLTCTLLWFSPHRFGEVVLWKSGAIGYLWGCVLTLMVCHFLSSRLRLNLRDQDNSRSQIGTAMPIACLALISFGWLEHLSIAMFASTTLLFAWCQRINGAIPRDAWVIVAGSALGLVILIAAPDNYVRASQIGYVDDAPIQLLDVAAVAWQQLTPLMLGLTAATLVATVAGYMRFRQVGIIMFPVFLVTIAVMSLLALAATPTPAVVERALFPFEFFMTIAAVMITGNLLAARNEDGKPWQTDAVHPTVVIAGSLCLFVALLDIAHVGLTYHDLNLQHARRDALLLDQVSMAAAETGDTAIIALPPLHIREGLFHTSHSTRNGSQVAGRIYISDITPDPTHWRNRCYAEAQDIPSVVLDRSAKHL